MSTELVWISSTNNTTTDLYKLSTNKHHKKYEYYDSSDDETISNLVNLTYVNIPTIMNVLHKRYIKSDIYTYYGDVLLSINPFKTIDIYDIPIEVNVEDPHVYSIAQKAYNNLAYNNQSILVSGESGSGKTENTKYMLNYLCKKYANNTTLASKIINSNYIIELFGNAKTTRNLNSSRFGKFIKLYVDEDDRIMGGNIESYLLEKSRITTVNRFEKSYHIFYLVCNNRNKLSKYNFQSADNYDLLRNSDIQTTIEDFEQIDLLEDIFKQFTFSKGHRDKIFAQLKLILELLNCKTQNQLEKLLDILTNILHILDLDKDDLLKKLTTKQFDVNSEIITKPLDSKQIYTHIRSFCEDTYETMFNDIIKHISGNLGSSSNKYISILDIFGFEVFESNGYEQLCINYTNEMLQSIFNEYIFKNEQLEYKREKITWKKVNYIQNDDIMDLFSGKISLFSIIDEQSILGSGNDTNIFHSLEKNISNELFTTDKKTRVHKTFCIRHFIGKVEYTINDFILKNRIGASKTPKIKTKLQYFMSQLVELKKELLQNNCYFIRCIKPNNSSLTTHFDQTKIYNQLLYSGVIQGIKIVLAGYPIKKNIDNMNSEFRFLSYYSNKKPILEILSARNLDENINHFQIGTTKIFMKLDYYTQLCNKNDKCRHDIAILIQKNIRRAISYKNYLHAQNSIVIIQACIRQYRSTQRVIRLRKYNMSIVINKYSRKYICLSKYNTYRQASIVISKTMRMYIHHSRYIEYMNSLHVASSKMYWWLKRQIINKRIRNRSVIYRLTSMLENAESKVVELSNTLNDTTLELSIMKLQLYNKDTEITKLQKIISEAGITIDNLSDNLSDNSNNNTENVSVKSNMAQLMSMNKSNNNRHFVNSIDNHYDSLTDSEFKSITLSSEGISDSDSDSGENNQYNLRLTKKEENYIHNSNLEELGMKMEKLYIELQDKNNTVELIQQNYRQLLRAYQKEKRKKSLWESVSSIFI